jgi:hypothetical protein
MMKRVIHPLVIGIQLLLFTVIFATQVRGSVITIKSTNDFQTFLSIQNISSIDSLILSVNLSTSSQRLAARKLLQIKKPFYLEFSNANVNSFDILFEKTQIGELCLVNCPDINLQEILKITSKVACFEKLSIRGCVNDRRSPGTVINPGLEYVEISTCQFTNLSKLNSLLVLLAKCKTIKELNLEKLSLENVPEKLLSMRNIKHLKLDHNLLTTLPREIGRIPSLEKISLDENSFIEEPDVYFAFRNSKLIELTIEDNLNDEDKRRLNETLSGINIIYKETKNSDTFIAPEFVFETPPDTQRAGTLSIYDGIKVYSNAYQFYPGLFANIRMTLDTSLFEDRYQHTDYSNGQRISVMGNRFNALSLVEIPTSKKNKNTIQFKFPTPGNLPRNYNELSVFYNYIWVYKGPLSQEEFRKQFFQESAIRDVKIEFDDVSKSFELEVKTARGFERHSIVPVFDNSQSPEILNKTWERDYKRYHAMREKRILKFNRRILLEKQQMQNSLTKRTDDAWMVLRNYMSLKEKQMSREEWLAYYQNIILMEETAIINSAARLNNLYRLLRIREFSYNRTLNYISNAMLVSPMFVDENNNPLMIRNMLLIDAQRKVIYDFVGNFT